MEVDKGAKLKETEANEFVNNGVKPNTEYECCLSCLELQDIITEANEKFVLLELEIAKQNSVIESLNQRNKELEKILIDLKKRLSSVNVITKTSSFSSAENKTKSNQDEDPSGILITDLFRAFSIRAYCILFLLSVNFSRYFSN
ncbi:hypothetical protein ACP275_06G024700 [Erythranthe tilingii]